MGLLVLLEKQARVDPLDQQGLRVFQVPEVPLVTRAKQVLQEKLALAGRQGKQVPWDQRGVQER